MTDTTKHALATLVLYLLGALVVCCVYIFGRVIAQGQEFPQGISLSQEELELLFGDGSDLSQEQRENIERSTQASFPVTPPNMVFVILDDVGEEMWPWMPALDALADTGLRFTNFWAQPFCSPFRSCLLTGEQGYFTGMTSALGAGSLGGPPLGTETMFTIPGYASCVVGKWHTSRHLESFLGPVLYGGDLMRGTPGNLTSPPDNSFTDWALRTAWMWGVQEEPGPGHATAWTTDEALLRADSLPEPFVLWVSHHAAHHPFQPPGGGSGQRDKYEKMVEYLDSEVVRLVEGLDLSDTYVFVMGDNGSPATVTVHPGKAKGFPYEPGVRVPCVAFGPGARTGVSDSLVSVVDFMPTAWELGGGLPPPPAGAFAGASLVPLLTADLPHHEYLWCEVTRPWDEPWNRHMRAMRGERYKLIRDILEGTDVLFDLQVDPGEDDPLSPWMLSGGKLAAYEEMAALMDTVPLP